MIIGITGKKYSGKDTSAKYFVNKGFSHKSFAAPIKNAIRSFFPNISEEYFEGSLKESPIPNFGTSFRHLAQTLGTDWAREMICDDFWIKLLFHDISENDIVISDVRFENEVKAIHDRSGIIIKVFRSGCEGDSHISEEGIPDSLCDFIIENNSSVEELYEKLSTITLTVP